MSFFGAVLLALFIYVLFRLARFYFRIKQVVNKGAQQASGSTRREGEVTINTARSKEKKLDNDLGEYVPFEEVDK